MTHNIPQVKVYRVRFEYKAGHSVIRAEEYVQAPTKQLALWAAREQRHGCMIGDPDCIKETVSVTRRQWAVQS